MIDLFTYGTLMHPEIWKSLVKTNYHSETFVIHNYLRKAIVNRHYPGMIYYSEKKVIGKLYHNVNFEDVQKLDLFEGDEYQRILLDPLDCNFRNNVQTYIFKGEINLLLDEDWSFENFVNNNLENFKNEFQGWENNS